MAGRYGTSESAQLPVGLNGHAMARRARPEPWKDDANCRGLNPEIFHVEDKGAVGRAKVAAARDVCDGCTVRTECLAYAIANNEELGIWGGTTDRQRRQMRKLLAHLPTPARRRRIA